MSEKYVSTDGRVLRATISTASKGSSLLADAIPQIVEAVAPLADDPGEIGAILLLGTGPNFCTGGDVSGFASADEPAEHVQALAGAFHAMQLALVQAAVPVVAAVHGWAAGAGLSIVLAADLAVAGESTRMRPAYPGIGFSPDGGMTWTLPRTVGAAQARRILLTDAVLSASEALDLGIVTSVVPDADVLAEAEKLAASIADGPTAAIGRIKRLLRDSPAATLADQLAAEQESIAASAGGAEGREGVAAFAERRPVRFR